MTKQSTTADFGALSKFVCRLSTNNSCPFDRIFLDPPTSAKKPYSQLKTINLLKPIGYVMHQQV